MLFRSEQVIRNLREHVGQCSDEYGDEGTADFLTGLMEQHEEMVWMLRSFIDGEALKSNGDNESRSEERRVGKECRSRWSPYH